MGGAATSGAISIQDVLQQPGITFINPQPASAGFTCAVATTTYASDTVNCTRPAALAANASDTVTLIISIADSVTATNFDNKAKTAGGGDPNKITLTTTGPIANCAAINEGWLGGGGTYFGGATTNAGCAFENTLLIRAANLGASKTNGTTTVAAGTTTTYTVTFVNSGPSAAGGAVVRDTPSAGLANCSVLSCTPAGAPTPATCPATPANLLTVGGAAIPSFPSNSSVSFIVRCGVTATGL